MKGIVDASVAIAAGCQLIAPNPSLPLFSLSSLSSCPIPSHQVKPICLTLSFQQRISHDADAVGRQCGEECGVRSVE